MMYLLKFLGIAMLFCAHFCTSQELIIDNSDDAFEVLAGDWFQSGSLDGYWGNNYIHDLNSNSFKKVRWNITLSNADNYQIFARWSAHPNRSTAVEYSIHHQHGVTKSVVNQQRDGGQWVPLGTFENPTEVSLSNRLSGGFVIADAIRLLGPNDMPDTDGDGVSDADESGILFSDLQDKYSLDRTETLDDGEFDSDGDGFSNKFEIANNYDPQDAHSHPPLANSENKVNGLLRLDTAISLKPLAGPPYPCTTASKGSVYYDDLKLEMFVCLQEEWLQINTSVYVEEQPAATVDLNQSACQWRSWGSKGEVGPAICPVGQYVAGHEGTGISTGGKRNFGRIYCCSPN